MTAKLKVLDRYVLSELLGPFFIGILGFILVLITDLLFTFTDMIINKGVPFGAVLKLLIFKLPALMILTFPVSTLFAVAMCLGRLSKDSEIVALRTSGITLFRISLPIILFSLVVSGVAFLTNEYLVPYANEVSQEIIQQIIMKKPLPQLKEKVFFKDAQERYYYVGRVDEKNNQLENIMIYEMGEGNFPRVIIAQKATFKDLVWDLNNGIVHKYDEKGHNEYEAQFEHMRVFANEDILRVADQKTTEEMSARDLKLLVTRLNKSGVATQALTVDLYMKYSVPLSSFIFALLGIPLSLPSIRSGRTWGMVMCIVVMFTFYVFASVFRSLGRGAILPPIWAAWFPQMLFGFLGLLLMWREWYK